MPTVEPIEVGDVVRYVDEAGESHYALVTAVWGGFDYGNVPSINLVWVSSDPKMDDPYGRQIERKTSIVHQSNQAAHGLFWVNIA